MRTERFERIEASEIALVDSKGRTRFLLGVTKDDLPRIELLNKSGKVLLAIMQRSENLANIVIGELTIMDDEGRGRLGLATEGESVNSVASLVFWDVRDRMIFRLADNRHGTVEIGMSDICRLRKI